MTSRKFKLRFCRNTLSAALVLCLICFLFMPASFCEVDTKDVTAEAAIPQNQRIINEFWGFKDGAPEAVNALAQTADGFLWLGTPAGLIRFDGFRFEPFRSTFGDQLLSTYVFTLFAPPNGGLWVGYAFGGFSFIKNGRVRNFTANTGTVYGLAQDKKGVVWAGTSAGLWRFDGSAWQHIATEWDAPVTMVCQVRFDHDGILWVLTDTFQADVGKGLFYLLPGGSRFRNAGHNLPVEGFTLDADDFVLTTKYRVGSPGSGIALEESLPSYPVLRKDSEQVLDRYDHIWLVPRTGPVLRHAVGGSVAETVSNASPSNSAAYVVDAFRYAHVVDREGSVWIGGQKGVRRFSFTSLVKQEFPSTETAPFFVLAPDEHGTVWISAGAGNGRSHLYRVVNGKAELQRSQDGVSNVAYRGIDRTLWFAGEGGLWHMINGKLTKIIAPPSVSANARSFQSITQDLSGGIWISIQGAGLYRYANGSWTPYGGRRDLKKGVVIEFTDKLGRVWFGYTKSRLAVLSGSGVKAFGPDDGIRVGNVTAIYGRGPKIWIGGEFGLQQFDNGSFHSVKAVDPEWLRGITGIVETENGDLWLNGLGGVFHISREELEEALLHPGHEVSGERFSRREGLPGLPQQLCPLITAVEGTDGRLWFAVTNGVVWLDPAQAFNKSAPPPVTIQSVSADDVSYSLDGSLKFPAHTSSIQISYAAISLSNPEAIRFRYRLRETDKHWQAATSNFASYRNLHPGSYHFLVNASDANGSWSNMSAVAEFTIAPAYYQTNWFRALCAVVFLLLLWAAYMFRVRQLRHEFEITLDARVAERTRIARELHDTLLQSFHGLMLRFGAVDRLLPSRAEEAKKELRGAMTQGAEAITEGRDAVQALRSSTIEANNLVVAIRTIGEELAAEETNKGSASFEVRVEGTPRDLRPLLRDEVYRVAAEALRNAFVHAHARHVEAEIRYDKEQFRLRVRDDGEGIDPAMLSHQGREGHYGLPGMRERAHLVGGKLAVWSKLDNGTEIELTIPAAKAYAAAPRSSWWSQRFSGKESDVQETKIES